jgi:hypothetical protein
MTTFFFIVGGLLFLGAIAFFLFVRKPIPAQSHLSSQLPRFTNTDPNASPISLWFSRLYARVFGKTAAENLVAAKNMAALAAVHHEAVTEEMISRAKIEKANRTLENENELLTLATAAGVNPTDYSAARRKVLELEGELEVKKYGIAATVDADIIVSARNFQLASVIRDHLYKLRQELEKVRNAKISETVKQAQIQDIENNIAILQLQLEAYIGKAAVPEING